MPRLPERVGAFVIALTFCLGFLVVLIVLTRICVGLNVCMDPGTFLTPDTVVVQLGTTPPVEGVAQSKPSLLIPNAAKEFVFYLVFALTNIFLLFGLWMLWSVLTDKSYTGNSVFRSALLDKTTRHDNSRRSAVGFDVADSTLQAIRKAFLEYPSPNNKDVTIKKIDDLLRADTTVSAHQRQAVADVLKTLDEKNKDSVELKVEGILLFGDETSSSFSRICGSIGMIVMAAMFVGILEFTLFGFFYDQMDRVADAIDRLRNFFLTGAALFAPYAFNKIAEVFAKPVQR